MSLPQCGSCPASCPAWPLLQVPHRTPVFFVTLTVIAITSLVVCVLFTGCLSFPSGFEPCENRDYVYLVSAARTVPGTQEAVSKCLRPGRVTQAHSCRCMDASPRSHLDSCLKSRSTRSHRLLTFSFDDGKASGPFNCPL